MLRYLSLVMAVLPVLSFGQTKVTLTTPTIQVVSSGAYLNGNAGSVYKSVKLTQIPAANGTFSFTWAYGDNLEKTATGSFSITTPSGPGQVVTKLDNTDPFFYFDTKAPFTILLTQGGTGLEQPLAKVTRRLPDFQDTQFDVCSANSASPVNCTVDSMPVETAPTGDRPYLNVSVILEDLYPPSFKNIYLFLNLRVYFGGLTVPVQTCAVVGVDHIEVVQTIQDVKNSIPLIANKPGIARVFFQLANPPQIPVKSVTAKLRGFRSGKELTGSPLFSFSPPITVPNVSQREVADNSQEFFLPLDWLSSGDLQLTAEGVAPPCGTRTDPLLFQGSETVSFGSAMQDGRESFRIGWIPLCFKTDQDCVEESSIPSYDYLLKKWYPIDPEQVHFEQADIPKQPVVQEMITIANNTAFTSKLKKLLALSEAKFFDQLVGFLPTSASKELAGSSTPNSGGKVVAVVQVNLSWAPLPLENVNNPQHYNGNSIAHEIAHNLGRRHTGKPSTWTGYSCGDADPRSGWPYLTADVQEVGYDLENLKITSAIYGDFMSYCSNKDVPDWVSPFTYTKLALTRFVPPGKFISSKGPATRATISNISSQVLISGSVTKDGSQARLDPAYSLVSGDEPDAPVSGGSHCLRFSGAAGPLSDFCFQLDFVDSETFTPIDREYFSWKVALPDGATRVALMTGGSEVASIQAGSAPPSLTITSPAAGDRWAGGLQTIAWSASSPDGLALTYAVQYSADGGQSWLPAGIDLTTNTYTFDPAQIKGGKNIKFRVLATDGLSTTSKDVGGVEVVQIPAMQVSAGPIDFGAQTAGVTASRTFEIKNTGSGPLSITRATVDGAALSVMPKTLTVPAGATRTLTVQWRVDSNSLPSMLHMASSDPVQPTADIPIRGSVGAAKIDLSSTTVDFGNTNTGVSPVIKSLFINSKGSAVLRVRSILISGAGFSLASAQSAPFDLGDASVPIQISFAPPTAGSFEGSLVVDSNDPGGAVTVKLIGTGVTGGATGGGDAGVATANLIRNGDAEEVTAGSGNCAAAAIPQWTFTQGRATVCAYSPTGISSIAPGPPLRGANYFTGLDATVVMTQTNAIPLTASAIDGGSTAFALEGWFGGYGSRSASPQLTLTFFSAADGGSPIGKPVTIGPVLGADRAKDNTTTGMELRSAKGTVPTGARSVRVDVQFADTGEGSGGDAGRDAVGDNFSLILTPPAGTAGGGTSTLQFSLNNIDAGGRVNFLGVPVGSTSVVQLLAKNTGTKPVSVTSTVSSNAMFSASPVSFSLDSGATTPFKITFAPTVEGPQTGVLTLNLGDGTTSALNLSGTGVTVPAILVSPINIDFGSVALNVNPPATTPVFISNKGLGLLTVQSLTIAGAGYTLVSPPATPFNVGDAASKIVVGFSPATAGPNQTGTLTIRSNDPALPLVTVSLSGTGVSATNGTATQLVVDDGTFEVYAGYPSGAASAWFVNRLTPPSYPATLRSVQIAFLNRTDSLAAGTPITVVTAPNPSGSVNLNNIAMTRLPSTVLATDAYNSYAVTPITITSGDFVVGFFANNPPNIYPMADDISSGSKQRSYLGVDGITFTLSDTYPTLAGNFGIRATVDLGGSGGGTAPSNNISALPNPIDFGSIAAGVSKDVQVTVRNTNATVKLTVSSVTGVSAPYSLIPGTANPAQSFDVQPGSTQTFAVRFTPAVAGVVPAQTMVLRSNDSVLAAYSVNITGTATGAGVGGGTPTSNLIRNGGAEQLAAGAGNCANGAIPQWTFTQGRATICGYSPTGISVAAPGPPNRGLNYFTALDATASMSQLDTIPLDAAAVDGGNTTFALEGWFGGYGSRSASAKMTITFVNKTDGTGIAVGLPVTAGPVLGADRARDNTTTGMEVRTVSGKVPVGARGVRVDVVFADTGEGTGGNGGQDAISDNLSLILTPPVGFGPTGGGGGTEFDTSIVGDWPLNDAPIIKDYSGLNNHGTAQGGVVKTAKNSSFILTFDGVTGNVAGNSSGTNFPAGNSPRTFAVFVNATTPPSSDATIFQYGSGTATAGSNFGLYLATDGRVAFGTAPNAAIKSATVVADGKSHLITAVYEGSPTNRVLIYVDSPDDLSAPAPDASGVLAAVPNTVLSSNWRMGAPPFKGTLSGAVLYNRALAGPDITGVFAGTGGYASMTTSASSLAFGSVGIGQTKDLTLTVGNKGTVDLVIDSLASSAQYSVLVPKAPFRVAAGSQQFVTVRYAPTTAGPLTGVVQFGTNDPVRSAFNLPLSGTGTAPAGPAISITPANLDFGTIAVGQTKDLILQVSNTGGTALTVSSISGSNGRFTLQSGGLPGVIQPGVTVALTIRFTPTSAGAQSGTLTFSSNDSAKPTLSVSVSGTGAAGNPTMTIVTAFLDFGTVSVNQSKDLTFTIKNGGTGPLTINSLTQQVVKPSPGSPTRFTVSPAAPLSIPAGATQTMTVHYAPLEAADHGGTLTIAGNDPAKPTAFIVLTGTGAGPAPIIRVAPSVDFGSVRVGQSKEFYLVINNDGNATLTVTSITGVSPPLGPGVGTDLLHQSFTTGPGSFQGFNVRYSPTVTGPLSQTMIINSNDPAHPKVTVAMTGAAIP